MGPGTGRSLHWEALRAKCLNQASDCTPPVMGGSLLQESAPFIFRLLEEFFLYMAPDWKSQLQIDPKRQKCLLRLEHGLQSVF